MRWQSFLSKPAIIYVISLAAGLIYPLAFAPLAWFPLAYLSVATVYLVWPKLSVKQAFFAGWLYGMGLFGLGVSWIYVAIHEFGNTSAAIAAVLVLIFIAFVSLVIAIQAAVFAKYCRQLKTHFAMILVFSSTWLVFEWLRGWILNGFPWLNLGTSQVDTVFVNWAPVFGVYGVTWISVFFASCLSVFFLIRTQQQKLSYIAVAGLILITSYGLGFIQWTQPIGKPITVSLVQGNAPQLTKWDADKIQIRLDTYARLTRENYASDLIIWPENSLTMLYHEIADSYLDPIGKEARQHNTDLVVGLPYMDLSTRRYYSSLLSYSDKPGVFHKQHLVPFGEFMPLESLLRGLVGFFDLPMSSFSHGPQNQPLLHAAGQPLATSICYEDAFGAELIRQLPEASLLVNGSNNAWYGNSFAPHQHLQISRMRSVETGRMMMRATTNGISAFIDHKGKIVSRSRQFVTTVLTDKVQPRQGTTFYVVAGNYPIVLFSLLIMAWVMFRYYKEQHFQQ